MSFEKAHSNFIWISNIGTVLQGHHALSICIEWRHWSWYKRGAGIWIDPSKIAPEDFIGNVNANADLKGFLTDNGFHESRKNAWYPFMKTIPATVFHDGNNDSCRLEDVNLTYFCIINYQV